MKKMLYILNIAKKVNNFSYTSMVAAKEMGIEFHIAGNWSYESDEERNSDEKKYGIKIHQIDFIRAPYHPGNRKAYKQLKELVKKENYDVIHCNTPIGGILGRIVGKKCNVPKIIYQAHGFHFFKGAPIFNWLIYYPIEKFLARYTDVLVTINHEDYELAKNKMKLRRGGNVYYVPGVGIDASKNSEKPSSSRSKRSEMGISDGDIALISMGDLVKRKNYDTSIRAIAEAKNEKLHYFICGTGPEETNLKALAQRLGVSGQIHFLGFRSDVKELLEMSDIFLFTTRQEGLPRSMMEAMSASLPCVASDIRGNIDLIEDGKGGYLCPSTDYKAFAEKINILSENEEQRIEFGRNNEQALHCFSIERVIESMKGIYSKEV
ncbi:MAG: glycosyltransferase family 4 protein [Clostridia bacterium]|nr:glycosyltransferase family 4 protein [Clostridia bacterium]